MDKFVPQKINTDKSLLKNQAYDIIKNAIINNKLSHDKIYSQEFLSKSMGISRTPVREALLQLQNEGMVKIYRGRGIQVISTTAKDLSDILELSDAVECKVCNLAAKIITASGIDKLEKIYEYQLQKANEKLVDDFMEQDRNFHLALALATGNKRLYESVDIIHQMIQRSGFFVIYNSNYENLYMIREEHRKVLDSLKKGLSDESENAMRIHIRGLSKRAEECFAKLGK